MMIIRLAFKNLTGAGLRTWLNTAILAIVFIVIIFLQGIYDGFQRQVERTRIAQETGREQLWFGAYDPIDPMTYNDNYGPINQALQQFIKNARVASILIISGVSYPNNRLQPVIIKGINPKQNVLAFPTEKLLNNSVALPAIIGKRMAKRMNLNTGDSLVVRWRNKSGSIDARDVQIVEVFETAAPAIDLGQIWIPLTKLQLYLEAPNMATTLVSATPDRLPQASGWTRKTEAELLADSRKMIEAKKGGASFLYGILMFLAMISLLDSQILAIFRRRKEVGLFLALGLTQRQVVYLFTVEGTLQGLLSAFLAAIIGGPIFYYYQNHGFPMESLEQFGLAGGSAMHPYFGASLIVSTFIIIMTIIILVSYWPARKIGRLVPTNALRGNWL